MVSQNSPYTAGFPSCLRAPSVRHTPFKIQNPCVMYKVFYLFLVWCSLVRVTTRWWMLMVAPISISYASVRVFSHGVFGAVLSGPFPALSFLKVCHLGGMVVQGITSLPVILWVTFSLSAVASPSPVLGGGGREKELIYYYYAQL